MEYMWCHKLLLRQFVTQETSHTSTKKEKKKSWFLAHDAACDIWHKANIQNFDSCSASVTIVLGTKCHDPLLWCLTAACRWLTANSPGSRKIADTLGRRFCLLGQGQLTPISALHPQMVSSDHSRLAQILPDNVRRFLQTGRCSFEQEMQGKNQR